jgi:hypothetical protein
VDDFFRVQADGAVGSVVSLYAVEVLVESDVSSAQLHVEADQSFGEVCCECDEGAGEDVGV